MQTQIRRRRTRRPIRVYTVCIKYMHFYKSWYSEKITGHPFIWKLLVQRVMVGESTQHKWVKARLAPVVSAIVIVFLFIYLLFFVIITSCSCICPFNPCLLQKRLYLFVLRFYGPVNPMGSCRARSVYLTTHLLGRLSPLSG